MEESVSTKSAPAANVGVAFVIQENYPDLSKIITPSYSVCLSPFKDGLASTSSNVTTGLKDCEAKNSEEIHFYCSVGGIWFTVES